MAEDFGKIFEIVGHESINSGERASSAGLGGAAVSRPIRIRVWRIGSIVRCRYFLKATKCLLWNRSRGSGWKGTKSGTICDV